MTYLIPDENVFQGIKVLLDDYVLVRNDDTFLIAYTPDSREPAAWIALALRQRGFSADIVPMRPLRDAEFAGRFAAALPEPADVPGRLVVFTLERDTMSHFPVFEPLFGRYGVDRTMVVRIISASTEFFTMALNVTPPELSALNASLLNRLTPARKVRVTTRGGTDMTVELDSERFQWISNRGFWRPGGFTILPAGEIATYPARVDGVFVADGAFNANIITSLNARLAGHPVRVELENSEATSLTCADPELEEMFRLCLRSPHGTSVGEFGLGTNHGIEEFIPANSHINERRCGVHLGFGQHNQSLERVPYVAEIHLDLITSGATVWVDDDPEPIDLTRVRPTCQPHPADALDEDITGDCCGFGYKQLQTLAACPAPGAPVRIPR
ncbi:M29 family metallopeptidase [Sphaerisporangium aureirubrum]|uniref:Crocagin biosynthetic protein CgnE/B domain-containing protein n=1 Tax=Sphaerisporangium aureirubrum TaxID=1544736 RepID=A0ABW1NVH0_9ACTN